MYTCSCIYMCVNKADDTYIILPCFYEGLLSASQFDQSVSVVCKVTLGYIVRKWFVGFTVWYPNIDFLLFEKYIYRLCIVYAFE